MVVAVKKNKEGERHGEKKRGGGGEAERKEMYFSRKRQKAQLWDNRKPESYGGIWTEVPKHGAVWPESVVKLVKREKMEKAGIV